MLESAALVGFVGVSDLVRARHGDQLGLLSLRDETPFALVAEAGGTMRRITAVDDVAPVPYTVLGWSVFDIDKTINHLVSRGVTFTRYEAMNQDQRVNVACGRHPAAAVLRGSWILMATPLL